MCDMNKLEDYMNMVKLNNLVSKKDEEKKKISPFVTALAVIGIIVSVAAIAFAIYKYLIPDYFEDYEDFEDDFDDFEDEYEEEMQEDFDELEETLLDEDTAK